MQWMDRPGCNIIYGTILLPPSRQTKNKDVRSDHLVLVLFVSLHQKYGTPYLLKFCNLRHALHLDVI